MSFIEWVANATHSIYIYRENLGSIVFSIEETYSGSQIDVRFLGRSIPVGKLPLYSKDGLGDAVAPTFPNPIVYYTYLRNAIVQDL
ncbi:MAG: hypothetical protein F6J93_24445 [Oscillatoria sp. SIO1A7]|nr:hypothetical protein [Oscillatoria sp. SIO1A7]